MHIISVFGKQAKFAEVVRRFFFPLTIAKLHKTPVWLCRYPTDVFCFSPGHISNFSYNVFVMMAAGGLAFSQKSKICFVL